MNEIITVENGKDIIDILYDGFVGCLKIRKPVAFDKYVYDSECACCKYFWLDADHLRIDEIYDFKEVLIFGNDIEVKTEIYSFLNVFSSGIYEIKTESLKLTNFDLHKDYRLIKDSTNYSYGYESKFDMGPYNKEPHNIMFTIPYFGISYERVRYYKELIEKGIRPKIITSGYEDVIFILDGHHKILAYQLSRIPAEIISITRLDDSEDDTLDFYLNYEFILSDREKKFILKSKNMVVD
ncbi:hypothetical protein OA88_14690 [Flavobacterium sp. JRM]|nr:hypothetical protein OA88_14690 [Flavobacterium sp. JRM]